MSTLQQSISIPQKERRRFLVGATTIVGAIGSTGLLIPFVASMNPSARARSAGAPVQIDIGKLKRGQQVTLSWRGKPVWVLHRTANMLKKLEDTGLLKKLTDPTSNVQSQQPDYAKNKFRSIQPEYFVTIALCTHLGCIPSFRPKPGVADLGANWPGGYFCPCHGSLFDLAGRVFKGVPAPTNLVIPPYQFLSDSVIEIGTNSLT